MKKIPLTRGQFALVDDEDFERVSKIKWQAIKTPNKSFYAVHSMSRGRCFFMHHFITGVKARTDHKDRNQLNNQKLNLRPTTWSQNAANSNKPRKICKFKGLALRRWKKWNTYEAYIAVNKKRVFLGCFYSEIEAAKAYDAAAIKFYGEFALTNKMLGLL